MLSYDIIRLIAGEEYLGGAGPLRLLSIAVLFSLYAYMYTQCILIPAKREDIVFKATALSAFANIVLNFILIPLWGINAAAITTIIAEAITFSVAAIVGRKYVPLNGIRRTVVSSVAGCFGIVAVCILAQTIKSYIVRIIVSFALSVVVYGMINLILNKDIVLQLKGLLKKG